MPPRRLRCKIKTANLLTRSEDISVPLLSGVSIANLRLPMPIANFAGIRKLL
jgi:hypothetical protein